MRDFLNKIREPMKSPIWKTMLFCVMYLILGEAAGVISKLSDDMIGELTNITSGMCVWILIGVLICAFTKSPFRSAVYVFGFCAAMIVAYYLTAEIGELYYSRRFVLGWSVFTLFTPIFALIAWYARGRGKFPWVLRIGIAVVMLGCTFLLFPGNVFFDLLFTAGAFAVTMVKSKPRGEANS